MPRTFLERTLRTSSRVVDGCLVGVGSGDGRKVPVRCQIRWAARVKRRCQDIERVPEAAYAIAGRAQLT